MKIDQLSSIRSAAPKRGAKKSQAAEGDFAKALAEETEVASSATTGSVGAVDALLSLQEVSDDVARDAQARRRGEDLLDRLEELRLGLLLGRFSRARLESLAQMVAERKDQVSDPALAQILEEIELRAAVELAKLGH